MLQIYCMRYKAFDSSSIDFGLLITLSIYPINGIDYDRKAVVKGILNIELGRFVNYSIIYVVV
jgi:hypothetical protein